MNLIEVMERFPDQESCVLFTLNAYVGVESPFVRIVRAIT